MAQQKRRKKAIKEDFRITAMNRAIDRVLYGIPPFIDSPFILENRLPENADIGHLNPSALRTYDDDFVDSLINYKAKESVEIPTDLKALCDVYVEQREALSNYHYSAEKLIEEYDIIAAKELGNFDPYLEKVVTRNDMEFNALYDYIALYRKIDGKRAISYWREHHPRGVKKSNRAVVDALEKARFSLLRLDKSLPDGIILATDIIRQKEVLFADRAMNASRLDGSFLVCSLLDMSDYVMTNGCGMALNPRAPLGKSVLTLFKDDLETLRRSKLPLTKTISECARKIYGFCLRSGVMQYMSVR